MCCLSQELCLHRTPLALLTSPLLSSYMRKCGKLGVYYSQYATPFISLFNVFSFCELFLYAAFSIAFLLLSFGVLFVFIFFNFIF